MVTTPDEDRDRVRRLLEQELGRVDSPEAAEAVVARLEELAAGQTEQQKSAEAAAAPSSAAVAVEQAARDCAPGDQPAAVLAETAAQAVAPTSEAPAVAQAARATIGARPVPAGGVDGHDPASLPRTARGRSFLREAVLRRMGPVQALDIRIFLTINGLPHPRWMNALVYTLTVVATGGWIWLIAVFGAYLFRVPRSWRAMRELLPSLVGATWIVEYPIKEAFRRRRPFIDVVRALVVGKKPGSFSFPSGHTASSFASAWVLSTIWPRRSPLFYALASCVGLSRIYLGAHYPGDVTAGAFFGTILAELVRRVVRRIM